MTSDSPKFKLPIVVATSQNKMNNFRHKIILPLIIHSFYNPAIWYCHSLLIVRFSFNVNTIYCHDINIVTLLLAHITTCMKRSRIEHYNPSCIKQLSPAWDARFMNKQKSIYICSILIKNLLMYACYCTIRYSISQCIVYVLAELKTQRLFIVTK